MINMNVEKIPATDVVNTDPVKANTDQNLAQIKNKMEQNELRTIPVVDTEGNLEGAISYRELIRFLQFNPQETSIEKAMHQPPEIEEGANLVDLAYLRINSGRKMLVKTEGEKLEGVVSDHEFIDVLDQVDELNNINTRDIYSHDLEKIFEEDKVEEARHLMLDKNISRLPVLDKNGKMTGILRSTDLLKAMIRSLSPDSGGTSGTRTGTKEVNIAGGDEKDKMSDIPVKELMSRDPYSREGHLKAKEAASEMKQKDVREIIFVDEGGYPESILTVKDFIDYLADFAPGQTILVNLVGLDMAEEKAVVHNQIKKQLQGSLGRKLERPEELTLRLKKAEKDGSRHRWELEMKLHCEFGILNIEEEGWDLMETVDEALNELNSVVRKEKDRRKP